MNSQMTPDWVMLGVTNEYGVFVLASSDLSTADLEVETRKREVFIGPWSRFEPGETVIHLHTLMGSYLMVAGGTYAEAIRNLFQRWAPEPERPVLAEPLPALNAP